jgi:hypothetical protein
MGTCFQELESALNISAFIASQAVRDCSSRHQRTASVAGRKRHFTPAEELLNTPAEELLNATHANNLQTSFSFPQVLSS